MTFLLGGSIVHKSLLQVTQDILGHQKSRSSEMTQGYEVYLSDLRVDGFIIIFKKCIFIH